MIIGIKKNKQKKTFYENFTICSNNLTLTNEKPLHTLSLNAKHYLCVIETFYQKHFYQRI